VDELLSALRSVAPPDVAAAPGDAQKSATGLASKVQSKGAGGGHPGPRDRVTVHYTGVIWGTGKVFDSSWTKGTPATFQTSGVIPGFGKALVGQKVGSQVIAVIPPADGYGTAGQAGAGISGTDTLVFVVDILATE